MRKICASWACGINAICGAYQLVDDGSDLKRRLRLAPSVARTPLPLFPSHRGFYFCSSISIYLGAAAFCRSRAHGMSCFQTGRQHPAGSSQLRQAVWPLRRPATPGQRTKLTHQTKIRLAVISMAAPRHHLFCADNMHLLSALPAPRNGALLFAARYLLDVAAHLWRTCRAGCVHAAARMQQRQGRLLQRLLWHWPLQPRATFAWPIKQMPDKCQMPNACGAGIARMRMQSRRR